MQKSKNKEDLRVRRTRKLLQTALMELTIREGFESVTVTDICEKAMVNRATFYRHYMDKYDLLDRYMDDLYHLLDESPGKPGFDDGEIAPVGLIHLMEHLRRHADFYRAMLGPQGYSPFAERIRSYIEKRIRRSLPLDQKPSKPGQPPVDMLLRSVSSAGLGAILWWLENSMPATPDQMATWAVQTSKVYLKSVLD